MQVSARFSLVSFGCDERISFRPGGLSGERHGGGGHRLKNYRHGYLCLDRLDRFTLRRDMLLAERVIEGWRRDIAC